MLTPWDRLQALDAYAFPESELANRLVIASMM